MRAFLREREERETDRRTDRQTERKRERREEKRREEKRREDHTSVGSTWHFCRACARRVRSAGICGIPEDPVRSRVNQAYGNLIFKNIIKTPSVLHSFVT